MNESYRIGEIARLAGVSVPAVRYYERLGLLPTAPRSSAGNRRYPHEAVERIHFVKRAQRHGLALAEIRELIGLKHRGGGHRCTRVQQLLTAKILRVDEQRAQLDEFRRTLQTLADQCADSLRGGPDPDCPVIARM